MMNDKNTGHVNTEDESTVLLQQLMHLKSYETPDAERMTRSRQNIMREVRKSNAASKKNFFEVIESRIPWFFAEPKFGIAAVVVAFIGLQYAGITANKTSHDAGLYMSAGTETPYEMGVPSVDATNSYPVIPSDIQLFNSPMGGDGTVMPAGFQHKK